MSFLHRRTKRDLTKSDMLTLVVYLGSVFFVLVGYGLAFFCFDTIGMWLNNLSQWKSKIHFFDRK